MKRCLENVQGVLLGAMIFFLGLSLLAMPQNSLLADEGGPQPGLACLFCSNSNCQAKYAPPDCNIGTCPPSFWCSTSCGCVPDGGSSTLWCDCE